MAEKGIVKLHPKLAKWQSTLDKRLDLQSLIVQPSFKMEYINTGSTVLNLLIGGSRLPDGSFVCPGWPKGTIIEIYGRESSGKSTIALTAMGQAIAQSDNACGLYIDLEHGVRDHYAAKLGVDFRSPTLGGSGRAIRAAPHTFEETESLVDAAALNGVDMIVIDSVAGLVSRREARRDISDEEQKLGVAEIPRLMSGWMPKLQAIIARTKSCVIFLNQTRDKIGARGFSEEALKSTTGGNALKFWASVRMMLKPREMAKAKIWNPILKKSEEVPIATNIEVKNIKNKVDARQGHSGLITLRYGIGIDELRTMMNVAEAYKIVSISKNKKKQLIYTYKSPGTGAVIEELGIEKFRKHITQQDNKPLFEEFMGLCVDKIMQGFKAIDDEELAQLAEDSIMKTLDDDDDYEDDGNIQILTPQEMDVEEEVQTSDINMNDL